VKPHDDDVILMAEVGSTAHGITHSSNDVDEVAVFVPAPWDSPLGVYGEHETYIHRPGRGPHDPSGPGDLDRTYHSLRKFTRLLVKGNPSILFTLFATQRTGSWLGDRLLAKRGDMRNSQTRDRYLSYMTNQRERIQGTRGAAGRVRRSPEGGGEIDWKYAMHMLRLGYQAYEYLVAGTIACPVNEPQRSRLIAVRSGHVPLPEVLAEAENVERAVAEIVVPEPDAEFYAGWSRWLADAHRSWWKETGQ
jgi:uncharacterized protein